jgi:hypothetical protein
VLIWHCTLFDLAFSTAVVLLQHQNLALQQSCSVMLVVSLRYGAIPSLNFLSVYVFIMFTCKTLQFCLATLIL